LLLQAFPDHVKVDVEQLLRRCDDIKIWSQPMHVAAKGKQLGIPYRVWADPPTVSDLTETQQTIYYCLFSRSTDGHVREASIRALATKPTTDWTAPYLFFALADYVIQVANVVANEPKLKDPLSKFAQENPGLYKLTLARAISYWNLNQHEGVSYESYRVFPPYRMLKSLQIHLDQQGRES